MYFDCHAAFFLFKPRDLACLDNQVLWSSGMILPSGIKSPGQKLTSNGRGPAFESRLDPAVIYFAALAFFFIFVKLRLRNDVSSFITHL